MTRAFRLRSALLCIALSAVAFTGCAEPPDKEIQQAESAIANARAAGADEYAHDEYSAALDAIKLARNAVGNRDYRQALDNALDSRTRAENAAKAASDAKAAARTHAERALVAVSGDLRTAESELKALEARRPPARAVEPIRHAVAAAAAHVQEARTAYGEGNYTAAADAASAANGQVAAAKRNLEAATVAASRRRR